MENKMFIVPAIEDNEQILKINEEKYILKEDYNLEFD